MKSAWKKYIRPNLFYIVSIAILLPIYLHAVVLLLAITYLIWQKRSLTMRTFIKNKWLSIFILYVLIVSLINRNYIGVLITLVFFLFVIYFSSYLKWVTVERYLKTLNIFVLGSIPVAIYALLVYVSYVFREGYTLLYVFQYANVQTRAESTFFNPNYYGLYCIFAINIGMYLLLKSDYAKRFKAYYYLSFVLNIMSILLTASRMVFPTVAVAIVWFVFWTKRSYVWYMLGLAAVGGIAYPVEDLMYAVMLQSANDATSALMWEIYGSEQAAVQAMQDQLTEWGITNAQIYSTSGAPNSEVPESWWMPGSNEMSENTMSAADMALVAQHTIEEYPQILDITTTREYTYMEGTDEEQILFNPNQLLEGGTYGRSGITGLKSGFTDAAGLNFVATGNQADRDFITVAMGTFGEGMSSYWEIEILLDGLLDHPEVIDLDLPTNLKAQEPAEELVEEAAQEDPATEDSTPIENNRDNAITNFMRDIFGVFN